jgi:hypothetical protein
MQGLMMKTPLTLAPLLERAARLFPSKEIVSRTETGMHRYTYADFHARVPCAGTAIAISSYTSPSPATERFSTRSIRASRPISLPTSSVTRTIA